MLVLSVEILLGLGVLGVIIWFALWPRLRAMRQKCFVRRMSPTDQAALSSAGIWFKVGRLDYQDSGVFVRQEDLDRVCLALHAYVLTAFETMRHRVNEVILRKGMHGNPELAQFNVNFISGLPGNADDQETVRELFREAVLPHVRSNVHVYDLQGGACEPADDDDVHIFMNAAPSFADAVPLPPILFGFSAGRELALEPGTYLGVPIVDPVSGRTLGEVVGKCLYIYFNAMATHGPKLGLLSALLDLCAPEIDTRRIIADILSTTASDGLPAALPEMGRVVEQGFQGHRRDVVLYLTREILGRGIERPIAIFDCRGDYHEYVRDDVFYILYNMKPISLSERATLPTGQGVPLLNSDGTVMAELVEDNLFIYSDVLTHGRREETRRFADLLVAARRQLVVSNAMNFVEVVAHQFVENCRGTMRAQAGLTAPTQDEVTAADQSLESLSRRSAELEANIVRLDHYPETELGREYDDLLNVDKVRDIQVTDTEIIVSTTMIFCQDPRSRRIHSIGEFKIHIPVDYRTGIRFINQTREVGGMHAPHVSANGYACLGNVQTLFPQLIQRREFATAVQLAIAFLESVNVDDTWGSRIHHWPVERGFVGGVAEGLGLREPTDR